ncbi:trimeric LpxA-like protein [Mariannaea sp. PMI_226]|nr:trimeric LpxA-like protein [Mariannaea sp. PMI_226]
MLFDVNEEDNLARMQRGELYYAFTPQLTADRRRARQALSRFNHYPGELTRRQMAEHWKEITNDGRPLPPPASTEDEEDEVLHEYPWIEQPFRADYGTNINVGSNVFINFNCTIIDSSPVSIGSRTLLGPNVSIYSGGHPLEPEIRNGTYGPEFGAPVTIGEDCWLGGNVVILPGNVPEYHVVAGNPARIIRKLERPGEPKPEVKDCSNVA